MPVDAKKNVAAADVPAELLSIDAAESPLEPPPIDEELVQLQTQAEAGDAEISKLKQMLDVLVTSQKQNVREAKILELFKKNVSLARFFEKDHLFAVKLKNDVKCLQEELLRLKEEEIIQNKSNRSNKQPEKPVEEINIWKDKYNQATAKLMELKGAKSVLTAEIGRLQHGLQREVGEHVSIAKVLDEGEHWKGRAQQISLLKDKIVELKVKVKEAALDDYQGTKFDATENCRKKQIEELANEFLATREEMRKTKHKVDCAIARRSILETETKNAKEKMGILVAKSDNDDRLIAALRQEIEASKQATAPEKLNQRISCPLRTGSLHREHQLAASFNDLKLHCREQVLQISAQAELIQYLRDITYSTDSA